MNEEEMNKDDDFFCVFCGAKSIEDCWCDEYTKEEECICSLDIFYD